MSEKKPRLFEVHCPDCQSTLWIDTVTRKVIKSERSRKKRGSLDEMLLQEKKRKTEFSHKFEVTAELQKEKRKKAEEKFRAAFSQPDEDDPS
jgi:hypothetical protein